MVMELPPMDLVTKVLDSSDLTGEKAVVAKMMKELQEKHPIQLQYDADVLLHALCKPWEVGGHAYDFKKCHRQLRITDPYQTYSTDQVLLQWHERVVAEREAWNRQRQLKAHMLFLLSKLQVAERQRRRTIEKRRLTHPEEEPADFKESSDNLRLLIDTYFAKRPSELKLLEPVAEVIVKPEDPPAEPATMIVKPEEDTSTSKDPAVLVKPEDPPTEPATLLPLRSTTPKIVMEVPSPRTVALRQEVKDLDLFDEKLTPPEPEAPKKKK